MQLYENSCADMYRGYFLDIVNIGIQNIAQGRFPPLASFSEGSAVSVQK